MPDAPSEASATPPARSFEQALAELEACVKGLESDDLPLEEALRCFERGVALVQECHERLDAAEQRLVELSEGPAGLEVRPIRPQAG